MVKDGRDDDDDDDWSGPWPGPWLAPWPDMMNEVDGVDVVDEKENARRREIGLNRQE